MVWSLNDSRTHVPWTAKESEESGIEQIRGRIQPAGKSVAARLFMAGK